jgi:Phosphatidylglycerophosphate synthase
MLGNHGRKGIGIFFTPLAKLLAKLHVTPNMVTLCSSVIITAISLGMLARGNLFWGGITVGLVLLADSVDGTLARLTGMTSKFGAFLDSSMDRITDGIVFGSVLWWTVTGLPEGWIRTVALVSGIVCMTAIGTVPYVRARAESLGVIAKVGLAERTDRLVIMLVCAGFSQLSFMPDWLYMVGWVWVAFASCVTIGQRMWVTWRELRRDELQERGHG